MEKEIKFPKEVLDEVTNNNLTSDEFRIFAYIKVSKAKLNKITIAKIQNKFNYSEELILKTLEKLKQLELLN